MTEKERKELLFKQVECYAAIYELHDGTGFYKNSENEWCFSTKEVQNCKIDWDTEPVKRLSKTYFDTKQINFSGFVTGIKKMRFSADLLIKQMQDEWGNVKIWRENEEFKDVALVYYANNHKRLVPVEYLTVLQEKKKQNNLERDVIPLMPDWQKQSSGFYSISQNKEFAVYIMPCFCGSQPEDLNAEAGLFIKSQFVNIDIEQLKRKFVWYLKEFMLDLPIMYEERIDGNYLFVRFNYGIEHRYTGFALLKSILKAVCDKED